MSIYNRLLIPETGEIDEIALAEAAKVYAAHEWGGADYPPKYLRKGEQWCRERAEAMKLQWELFGSNA